MKILTVHSLVQLSWCHGVTTVVLCRENKSLKNIDCGYHGVSYHGVMTVVLCSENKSQKNIDSG